MCDSLSILDRCYLGQVIWSEFCTFELHSGTFFARLGPFEPFSVARKLNVFKVLCSILLWNTQILCTGWMVSFTKAHFNVTLPLNLNTMMEVNNFEASKVDYDSWRKKFTYFLDFRVISFPSTNVNQSLKVSEGRQDRRKLEKFNF